MPLQTALIDILQPEQPFWTASIAIGDFPRHLLAAIFAYGSGKGVLLAGLKTCLAPPIGATHFSRA
jgi:hypothetical protein